MNVADMMRDLTEVKSNGKVGCAVESCEAMGDDCYICEHFQLMRDKLWQCENEAYRDRAGFWQNFWRDVDKEVPPDDLPKLLCVRLPDWSHQYVAGCYMEEQHRWTWLTDRGEFGKVVFWADVPTPPDYEKEEKEDVR